MIGENKMGYVYKYTDVEDNIVKYVGIVWSKNRTLLQRVEEHQMYDEWCNGKKWKIEFLEIDNKTDCEGLEGHFISLYDTRKWYNKEKVNWGISSIYSMVNWQWKILDYIPKDIKIKKRQSRRINNRFLINLYNKSIYIFNNGAYYCFFRTFKKEPIYVYMALSPEKEEFAIKNNIRYMNREQLNFIIRMIKENNKPFGYSLVPNEIEQVKMERNLTIEQCFTYKEYQRLFSEVIKENGKLENLEIEYMKRFIRNCVYEMQVDIEHLQVQKCKIYI